MKTRTGVTPLVAIALGLGLGTKERCVDLRSPQGEGNGEAFFSQALRPPPRRCTLPALRAPRLVNTGAVISMRSPASLPPKMYLRGGKRRRRL